MAGLFIKLDHDWMRDAKVRNFRKKAGKAGLVDLIQLYILMARCDGRVDLKDYGQLEDAKDVMGMTEQRLERFLGDAADCGIISADLWRELRVVTSDRAVADAMRKKRRADAGREGGEASGASRRRKRGEASASQASASDERIEASY